MEECKDAKGDAEVGGGGELPIAKTDIGVAELQLLVLLAYLRSPNSLTYNFCWGFQGHHLGTDLRFPYTMFTNQFQNTFAQGRGE
jgi:hypothetical protein